MVTRERDSPSAFRAPFPIVEAKLTPAVPRPELVPRTRLLALLREQPERRIVSITAPPGYGKTTLLGQWVAQEAKPVAWVAIDDFDNDPTRLLAYLAVALDRVHPIDPALARALAGPAKRLLATAVPRLASELHAWDRPALIVIDDAHRLVDRSSLDALASLIDHLPGGFRVAMAARSEPDLPFARFRVQRDLLEIGPMHLALDEGEAMAVAAAIGCRLGPGEARELTLRTEGWAAAVYLAALARTRGSGARGSDKPAALGDHHVTAYLRSEVERHLGEDDLVLLTRTSILDPVDRGAAEAVTGVVGTSERLAGLARDNLLITVLGQEGSSFRYHHLLREFLRAELDRREPGSAPELHRRAAAWYAGTARMDAAVEHAFAGGSPDTAAGFVIGATLPMFNQGQATTLDRWLARFDTADFERRPPLAVIAAWIHVMSGRAREADHMADIAERGTWSGPLEDGSASFESQRAILRTLMCRNGPRDMLANASFAVDREGPASRWRPNALFLQGIAYRLLGDWDQAARVLDEAIETGDRVGAPGVAALAARAGLSLREGDVPTAERLAGEARERLIRTSLDGLVQALAAHAMAARVATQRGDLEQARRDLVAAQLVRPLANHGAPAISVGALLDLARAHLSVSDPAGAQVVLREAEQIVRFRPALGTLTDELVDLRRKLAGATSTLAGSSTLTAAELRVLMLLPTYLSFQEIADRLQISRNTVKTHAVAIYGKLWASSRGEAVERAVDLGLLEPYPGLAPLGAPRTGTNESA